MSDDYKPLFHEHQKLAAPNHVMILYLDADAEQYAVRNGQKGCVFICIFGGVIFLFMALAILTPVFIFGTAGNGIFIGFAVGFTIAGILCLILGKYMNSKSSKIDVNIGYSYYCYDINDQCVKLAIFNNTSKEFRYPQSCNFGYINEIREIKHYSNGSDASYVVISLIENSKQSKQSTQNKLIQKDLFTLDLSKRKFAKIMTKRVLQIKDMGLNHVQLEYQQMHAQLQTKSNNDNLNSNANSKVNEAKMNTYYPL